MSGHKIIVQAQPKLPHVRPVEIWGATDPEAANPNQQPQIDPADLERAQAALAQANQNLTGILSLVENFRTAVVTYVGKDEEGNDKTMTANVVNTGMATLLPGDSRVKGNLPVLFSFMPVRIAENRLSCSDNMSGFNNLAIPLDRVTEIKEGPAWANEQGEIGAPQPA